jgi:hypothetical protein
LQLGQLLALGWHLELELMDSHVDVMLCRASGFSSRAIEWFGGGHWSHFANIIDDRHVLDARSDRVGGAPPGVYVRDASYLDDVERTVIRIPCSAGQAEAWLHAGRSQLKKPYDTQGIIAFATGRYTWRDWRDPAAWICSELGIWMLEQSRICPILPIHVNEIAPGPAGLICCALPGAYVFKKLFAGDSFDLSLPAAA